MRKKETLKKARERNQRAFLRLRKRLAETPPGQWIGLVRGKVVATALTLDELEAALNGMESDRRRTMVFRAGDPYPRTKSKLPILPLRW